MIDEHNDDGACDCEECQEIRKELATARKEAEEARSDRQREHDKAVALNNENETLRAELAREKEARMKAERQRDEFAQLLYPEQKKPEEIDYLARCQRLEEEMKKLIDAADQLWHPDYEIGEEIYDSYCEIRDHARAALAPDQGETITEINRDRTGHVKTERPAAPDQGRETCRWTRIASGGPAMTAYKTACGDEYSYKTCYGAIPEICKCGKPISEGKE